MSLKFTLKQDAKLANGKARLGTLQTAHGSINTPIFMPVGTKATVKGVLPETLHKIGFEIILGNTYHLMLTPNPNIVQSQGGLHKFMNWSKGILTDSGGYQVMSLSSLRKITEDNVEFRSHIDGSKHIMSPEISVQIQHKLDSNISMVLDECIPYGSPKEYVLQSTQRTTRWAKRSKSAFIDQEGYGIFGIVQGGVYEDLRKLSAENLIEIDHGTQGFDGYAIGGLAIGEPQAQMFEVLEYTTPLLPADKPRYLMGVGRPSDIIGAIALGVDMFDCVLPTRMGRNARAFTSIGEVNIRNSHYKNDSNPLDTDCQCTCCSNYSKAYLHHLFKVKEMLGGMLLTEHNLFFYHNLCLKSRAAIANNNFMEFKDQLLEKLKQLDNK
ncbi:tRNA guanosine(34) transglycosylase Tgt [Candidatus Hepatincolaceae symbiont of Richtersius coronifer]